MKPSKNLFNTILAIVVFIVFWDYFVASRYRAAKTPPTAQQEAVSSEQSETLPEPELIAEKTFPSQRLSKEAPAKGLPEQFIVLRGEKAEVTLGAKGARIISWKVQERNHWVELVPQIEESAKTDPAGASQRVFPLETFPELDFRVEKVSDKEVVLKADHPQGIRIRKTLTLDAAPPFHFVSVAYTNMADRTLSLESPFGWGDGLDKKIVNAKKEDKKRGQMVRAEMRAVAFDGEAKSWRPGFIRNRSIDQTIEGQFEWAGVDNDHFLAVFVAEEKIPALHVVADKKTAPRLQLIREIVLQPGRREEENYQLYVGPKLMSALEEAGHNLPASVEFGFFGIISKGLLKGLVFFQSITGNYGWAIIILTVCIQILFFPLTKKSLQHSVKMKEVQPQLKKIQEQFKSDPKRLQMETFNLYKKNGMKFMGMEGCFPMLIQIPIFFAFYRTLRVAYELRGAPWIFWITDLALPDPFYVLPVVMGGGMLLQQKLTSVAADPTQAKMMLIMPIMFTFFFLKLPAGLVLYWCVNSVTTIIAQKILQWQKHHLPKPAAP